MQEEPLGSIHAVYVGLNYNGTGISRLRGTLNDAKELEQCLALLSINHDRTYQSYSLLQGEGTEVDEYDDPSTFDSLPTKTNVLAQIEALKSDLTENDLTIFSYSGHGYTDGSLVLASPNSDGKILLDKNNKPQDEEVLLSVTDLLLALSELPGKQLLILDSCHCGSFVEDSGSSVSLIEKSRFLDKAFDAYFSSESYNPSLFVLAATTSDNTSLEMPPSVAHIHGYFTAALLDGLGWDHANNTLHVNSPAKKKGVITLDNLYRYILENKDYTLNEKYIIQYQHPTINGGAYTLRLF